MKIRRKHILIFLCVASFVIVISLFIANKIAVQKAKIAAQLEEVQKIEYNKDAYDFVKEYILAVNQKKIFQLLYMDGVEIEDIEARSKKTFYGLTFPNITKIITQIDDQTEPVIRVYWEKRVHDLDYTDFLLKWNEGRNMWNIASFGY